MEKTKKVPKKVWLPLTLCGGILILGLLVFLLVYFCALKVDIKVPPKLTKMD